MKAVSSTTKKKPRMMNSLTSWLHVRKPLSYLCHTRKPIRKMGFRVQTMDVLGEWVTLKRSSFHKTSA